MPLTPQSLSALPETFIFGVATADHQCEAYDPNYEDIRDIWEQRLQVTARGKATDFWNRYTEDIQRARALGCKAFRFSLAWSRLEPTPGHFSDEAFAHYQHLIETIRAAGMEPIMTLHHFTWPVHVEERGGLIGEEFPAIFTAYVSEVVRRLGPFVHYWITFNEPTQLAYGYVKPWWQRDYFMPPGLPGTATLDDQMQAVGKLMRNLFLAHTSARQIIKQTNPTAAVGVNPMLLGLPGWLQRLVDFNATKLRNPQDLHHQVRRFARRGLFAHGKVDVVLANLTITSERADQIDFSEAYYIAGQTFLVRADSQFKELQDLANQTVAVLKHSTAEKSVHALLPAANAQIVKTHVAALQKLDHGQVAALLDDDTILLGLMEQYPNRYRVLHKQLTTEPYVAAVAKGHPELLEAVDNAVRDFKDSGAWAASFTQHFPDQPVLQPPQTIKRATLNDINGLHSNSSIAHSTAQAARHKSLLEHIKERGYLIVAVKQDVPGFGYRDAHTGKLCGLEIDLARAIARHIFGDPSKVVFRPVYTRQRLSFVRSMFSIFDPLLKLYTILSTALTSNWWHLGMAGKLPTFLCPQACVGQQDFIGFDYYWGISVLQPHRVLQLMDAAFGRYDKAPVWSGALYDMLKYHTKLFPDKEILIIENGSVDEADGIDRTQYISQHIRQVQRACQEGVKVVAYTCWSITSNREWGLKFDPSSNFGLYYIDLDNDAELKRIPTDAVQAYQKIIEQRGVI